MSSREIDSAITKAKAQYPIYANFDAKLITSIINCESAPIGNFFSISPTGALGLGQEIPYIDVNLAENKDQPYPIYAQKKFETLQKSDNSDQDMHTFKTETFLDNRTLIVESIAIMFAHLAEIRRSEFVGEDLKKTLAGYKWGQGYLKKWLDYCQNEGKDWYENLGKDVDGLSIDPESKKTKTYIEKVLSYYSK